MGNMNGVAHNKYREYFRDRFSKYGENAKSLWGSKESQFSRFEILSQISELKDKSLLDVGCGFGDFYDFLVNYKKVPISKYIGIDLSPEIIEVAKKNHPEITFLCIDILNLSSNKDLLVDYSVASGIFFLPVPNWEDYVVEVCRKMFEFSKIGIGINFLSIFSPNRGINKESFYADPSKVFQIIIKELSHKVTLRHDYRENDFTIYVYK